jgi:tetratricopeptide (TPR) repeat protein
VTESPVPLIDRKADVSAEFNALIMQLLEKDPNTRPPKASDVATALRALTLSSSSEFPSGPVRPVARPKQVNSLVEKAITTMHNASTGGPSAQRQLDEAKTYLDAAFSKDDSDPHVLAALGRWNCVYAMGGYGDRDEYIAAGRRLLLQALIADDDLPEVHATLGKLALFVDDDLQSAERFARRAVELDSKDPEGLRFLSVIEKMLGRSEEAVAAATRATNVAPELPHLWNGLGDALLSAGRNAEAVLALKKAVGLKSGYAPALERLELARVRLNEMQYAVELRVARLRITGENERAETLEAEALSMGAEEARRRDIQRELNAMLVDAETTNPFADHSFTRSLGDRIVNAYAELGQWGDAMTWIERAYAHRPGRLRRILTDQPFDRRGLAVDPRYARVLRVAGLEELL